MVNIKANIDQVSVGNEGAGENIGSIIEGQENYVREDTGTFIIIVVGEAVENIEGVAEAKVGVWWGEWGNCGVGDECSTYRKEEPIKMLW